MAGLLTIVNAFEDRAEASSKIQHFIYGRVSSINVGQLKSYPAILLESTPGSRWEGKRTNNLPKSKEYRFKIFLYDTYKEAERSIKPLKEKQDEIDLLLDQYVAEMIRLGKTGDYEFYITSDPEGFLAEHMHNDDLVQAYLTVAVISTSHCELGTFE